MATTLGLPDINDIRAQLEGFELTPEIIDLMTTYVTMVQLQTQMGQLDLQQNQIGLQDRQVDLGLAQTDLGFAELGFKEKEWDNRLRLDDLAFQTAQENRQMASETNAATLERILMQKQADQNRYKHESQLAAVQLAMQQEQLNSARGLSGRNANVTPYYQSGVQPIPALNG